MSQIARAEAGASEALEAGGKGEAEVLEAEAVEARGLRRDAERNRARILEGAARLFATRGLEVSMDDIAEAAGVGVGTVYRRFPDRAELVSALFEQRVSEIVALARQAEANPDAWDALAGFLESTLELEVSDRGLAEVLRSVPDDSSEACAARDVIAPIAARLLERAQAAGLVRAELCPVDLGMVKLMLLDAAYRTRDIAPDAWRRYLALALESLRPWAGAAPLPAPMELDQIQAVFRGFHRRVR